MALKLQSLRRLFFTNTVNDMQTSAFTSSSDSKRKELVEIITLVSG